ncbi:hypothetical protein SAMD00023353_0303260 [Rosellinia necatrix]|uniref:Uncharacterized protein n=1 Tax=Rosellinia necatrix TaxID=77044 RepID=A0A1S8A6B8_ROSNE|nr:hypothetical protein SAMD00023353_0303260 [Rosellinia necatrix]
MGNICGKEADSEAFSQPGRVLGSAPPPPQPQRASVPAHIGGPPRTLGGSFPAVQPSGGGNDDARRRAAEAAEARAQATSAKASGKLSAQLAAQKKQTRNDLLQEISNDERRQRDADEAAQVRAHH